MPIQFFPAHDKLEDDEKATATYSSIRTGILSLTPGDHKCRLYCSGADCRFCVVRPGQPQIQALDGLYSTWITDQILAMARLQQEHFEKCNIIDQFQKSGIKSVVNLQESGEHAYCGVGLHSSGFSYDPEMLMRAGIYHYNFPLADFEACSSSRLLDIVKVTDFALTNGKIAVHCHAGHGRTGMVIAAWLIYSTGCSPAHAVRLVRSRRAKAVQSRTQVDTLHKFKILIQTSGGMIIPMGKFAQITDYVAYNHKFLPKPEARLYGQIPKIVYVIMHLILQQCFDNVTFNINQDDFQLSVECSKPRRSTEHFDQQLLDSQLNDDNINRTQQWYLDLVKKGLTIATIHRFLENEDFRDLIRLLDLFFHSTFHQLTHRNEISHFIDQPNSSSQHPDWSPTFCFLLSCVRALPSPLHFAFSRLISKWFVRSELELPVKIRLWLVSNKSQ